MILQDEYNGAARRSDPAAAFNAASAWTQSLEKVTEQVRAPGLPANLMNVNTLLTQWFDFANQLAKVNREYVLTLAGALGDAVRQPAAGLGEAAREQLERAEHEAAQVKREKRERAEEEAAQADREKAEQAEQAERERVRKARAAEREQARQERRSAHERYEGLSKAALVEELGSRGLPKSGKIDDLIERLVDADTK